MVAFADRLYLFFINIFKVFYATLSKEVISRLKEVLIDTEIGIHV